MSETKALRIYVPMVERENFWDEPPGLGHPSREAGTMEFWAFRRNPRCQPGDTIEFYISGEGIIATAIVDHVEPPGQSSCEHSGRFKNHWKVFWRQEAFQDLRKNQRAKSKWQKCG